MLASDIHILAHKYGYKIKTDTDKIIIQAKFNPISNNSILSYFLFLIGSTLIFSQLITPKSVFFIILGFFSVSFSLINIILHLNQKISVQKKRIQINSRLKIKNIDINNSNSFKMKTEKYHGRSGKTYLYLEIFLESQKTNYYVLSFIKNTDYEKEAIHFGSELKQILNYYKNKSI